LDVKLFLRKRLTIPALKTNFFEGECDMAKLSLEERVDQLEAIECIKQLKYRYCKYCDAGYDAKGIASLFADDAVADYGSDYNVGADQIFKRFVGESTKIPFAAHMVTNPLIHVNGDTAHGTWWIVMPCTRMVNEKPTAYWFVGEYDEDYVKINGEWKFKTLRISQKFWTPHLED
jgi:hypothetical protein